jgi:hypothetical protein
MLRAVDRFQFLGVRMSYVMLRSLYCHTAVMKVHAVSKYDSDDKNYLGGSEGQNARSIYHNSKTRFVLWQNYARASREVFLMIQCLCEELSSGKGS